MSRWPRLLANELRLRLYRARRYWGQTLLGLLFSAGLFGGLLLLVAQVSGRSLGSGGLDGLLFGMLLWTFASSAYGSASEDIAEESRQRTLEGLCVAPLPLPALLLLRASLGLLASAGWLVLLGLAVGWASSGRLQLSLPALGLLLLAAPALLGVGFASAGVLLLAKRAEALPAVFSLSLMALVALPAHPANGWALLPYALGASGAKLLSSGLPLAAGSWGWVALNSAVYLLLGLALFGLALRRARRLGVLGHG